MFSTIDTFDVINSCPTIKHNIVKNWGNPRQRKSIIDSVINSYFSQSDVEQYDMLNDKNDGLIIESDARELVQPTSEVAGNKQKVQDFLVDGLSAFKMPK